MKNSRCKATRGWLAVFSLSTVAVASAQSPLIIDFSKRAQTIENIGSSTGMHGDYISRNWKPEAVDAIAELLFSRDFDGNGRPKGIGLSGFRIQIGGGGEGEAGGIHAPWRRTDCFLRPDGSYNWNHDRGVLYWRKKAEQYGVPTVIGYLNSPPAIFTESGYTFKTNKTFTANLKPEHYGDYAGFLARVAGHFQSMELPFTYISPVNEPQWDWDGVPGKAKQEGSPWTNEQIARLVRLIDGGFRAKRIKTRLLIPEAAEYRALCEPMRNRTFAAATDQIRAFWSRQSPDYLGNLQSLEKAVAGHAYFSDGSIDTIIRTRRAVTEVMAETDPNLRFWQTEYSLLGEGWTGGLPADAVDEMTAALLLARTIHADFTLANAAAWQWWSSTEPRLGRVPRFCLIECDASGKESYRATKLLWTLGHYSRFVRPGMVRVEVKSDVPVKRQLAEAMVSAFLDEKTGQWVMVLINFSDVEKPFTISLANFQGIGKKQTVEGWITDGSRDMERLAIPGRKLALPPKSIITLRTSVESMY